MRTGRVVKACARELTLAPACGDSPRAHPFEPYPLGRTPTARPPPLPCSPVRRPPCSCARRCRSAACTARRRPDPDPRTRDRQPSAPSPRRPRRRTLLPVHVRTCACVMCVHEAGHMRHPSRRHQHTHLVMAPEVATQDTSLRPSAPPYSPHFYPTLPAPTAPLTRRAGAVPARRGAQCGGRRRAVHQLRGEGGRGGGARRGCRWMWVEGNAGSRHEQGWASGSGVMEAVRAIAVHHWSFPSRICMHAPVVHFPPASLALRPQTIFAYPASPSSPPPLDTLPPSSP